MEETRNWYNILAARPSGKGYRRQRFRTWICYHLQVRWETPTVLGPLKRANVTWRQKHTKFSKCCVLLVFWLPNDGQSQNSSNSSVMRHHQNPSESTSFSLFLIFLQKSNTIFYIHISSWLGLNTLCLWQEYSFSDVYQKSVYLCLD
jgi:hypothetical protein